MKFDLIGMIFNSRGRKYFEGAIVDDNGKALGAIETLDYLIMEYAKVRNGGTSEAVVIPKQFDVEKNG
jgi:hypothetical protein